MQVDPAIGCKVRIKSKADETIFLRRGDFDLANDLYLLCFWIKQFYGPTKLSSSIGWTNSVATVCFSKRRESNSLAFEIVVITHAKQMMRLIHRNGPRERICIDVVVLRECEVEVSFYLSG